MLHEGTPDIGLETHGAHEAIPHPPGPAGYNCEGAPADQYFGRDYGLTFIAPQGLSTASEASAKDVARLIEVIRSYQIHAVFPENVTDLRLLKRIAKETGTTIGGKLYPGPLTGPDGPVPTYIDMMRHNARTLAQALLW